MKKRLLSKFCFIAMCLFFSFTINAAGDYYIDPSATNSTGAGTIDNPWTSLAQINSGWRLAGGGHIYLKRGQVFKGQLKIWGYSGTATKPIVVTSYGNAADANPLIIFDAASNYGVSTPKDKNIAIFHNSSYVTVDGVDITDPSITDLDHSSTANAGSAVYVDGTSTNCIFKNMTISKIGAGFTIRSNGNRIEGCTIENLRMVINDAPKNNDYGAVGVWLQSSNNVVTKNIVRDCWGTSSDYGFDGGAFEIYGGAPISNNEISYNTAINNEGFFEMGSYGNVVSNDNKIFYNKVINNGRVFIINQGNGFTVNVTNLMIYNNLFVETVKQRTGSIYYLGTWNKPAINQNMVILKNNIFFTRTPINVAFQGATFPAGTLVHENNIYRMAGGNLNFAPHASEIVLTGAQNLFTDTTNADPALWDFFPAANGAQVDFGQNLGFTLDFNNQAVPFGDAPDAGILESNRPKIAVMFGPVTASVKGQTVTIDWTTLKEWNSKAFEVQVGNDSVNFKTVATIDSKAENGVSDSTLSYIFTGDIKEMITMSVGGLVATIILLLFVFGVINKRAFRMSILSTVVLTIVTLNSCKKVDDIFIPTPEAKKEGYVRIAHVDKDGNKTYSDIIKVTKNDKK